MMSTENNYYNKELKKRYLEERERYLISTNYIDVQFRKCAEMEYKIDKDISNWTYYEIVEYYKSLNLTSIEMLMCMNSILSQYCQFCLENSLVVDKRNHFLECTTEILADCVNRTTFDKKMVSRKAVLQWVDSLPNPKDQFILLSLFEFGKSKDYKNIVNVRMHDLDVKNNELELQDRIVKISDKLISIIHNCKTENTYYSITGKETKIMPLIDYGYIVKSYPNQNMILSDFQKGRNIYIACKRMFNYLGVGEYMSPNSIVESGKLHMIMERAKELGLSEIQYLYSEHIKEVEMQFGCTIKRSVYVKKYDDYLE